MRSQVQGSQPGNSEVSMTRTSKTGWLQDSFHPIVRKLSERISWMTGLNTDTWKEDAELLQVRRLLLRIRIGSFYECLGRRADPARPCHCHTAEINSFQVANYLNGGHYNPHHDYVMKDKSPDHVKHDHCQPPQRSRTLLIPCTSPRR